MQKEETNLLWMESTSSRRKRCPPSQGGLAAGTCFMLLMVGTALGQRTDPVPGAPTRSYSPASINASQGLECKLYPAASAPSTGVPVLTDDDGYARFYTVRATEGDAVRQRLRPGRATLFASRPAAEAVGLRPCKTCRPDIHSLSDEVASRLRN
jgi:hypothetical protein